MDPTKLNETMLEASTSLDPLIELTAGLKRKARQHGFNEDQAQTLAIKLLDFVLRERTPQ